MTIGTHSGRQVAALVLLTVLAAAAGCGRQPAPVAAPPAPDRTATGRAAWKDFAGAFIEAYFKLHPFFAAQAGRHEFDGQMSDWSAAAFKNEVAWLRQERAEIEKVDPQPLEPAQRLDREYVLTVLDSDLFWIEQAQAPYNNPAWYLGRMDPELYLNRNYAPLEKRLPGYLGYARAIPQLAAQIRANLKTPL